VDSGLPEGDPLPPLPPGCFALEDVTQAAETLVREIRTFRPQVILTYDEEGGYPHPDHIMTHQISLAAFEAAGDPERYPHAGEPWQPMKLYYHMRGRARTVALHEAMLAAGLHSPYEKMLADTAHLPDKGERITTRVPCGEYFGLRDDALRAHATQVDPTGWWFLCPLEIQQQVWPTEDYQLAHSLVDSALPEDDLFAGVRETICAAVGPFGVG
jgi:mycothiol S-conjugate amidase